MSLYLLMVGAAMGCAKRAIIELSPPEWYGDGPNLGNNPLILGQVLSLRRLEGRVMVQQGQPSQEKLSGVDGHLSETLTEAVGAELESFVRLELAAEQMLEDEALLVSAYIKEDVAEVQSYLSELGEELKLLEARAAHWLLNVADPTAIDWHRLARFMGHAEQVLIAGEVADNERLRCLECGAITKIRGLVTVQPCQNCQCDVFQRQPVAH